jgi:LCP family protein required for cell wall assembly
LEAPAVQPPPRSALWRRVLVGTTLAVLGVVAAAAAIVGTQSALQKRSPVDVVTAYFVDPPQTYFHKDRIALLLLGIDYNYDDKDQEYSSSARSDTIMAVSLNFPEGQKPSVSVLSVPRDTDAVMPDGHEDKINTAYALGGAKLSEKVIAKFLGLPGFDRYVTLRINATKELVDAIGGIDVVPDETMNYDDSWGHLHIHFIGGKKYHMNGEQAVSYSRFRHDACSDPCRIKRQQQVVRIMIAKLKNDKFNDLLRVKDLVGVLNRNVMTDLTAPEEISLASAFKSIDLKDVASDQVPYVDDKELACCGDVLIPDDAAKAKDVQKYFLTPIVAQGPTPPPPDPSLVAAISPSTIRIEVENGSGEPGLGSRVAAALRAQGFTVSSVTNADSFAHDATEIHVHSLDQPLAGERVRLALPAAVVSPDAVSTASGATEVSDVTVIVGRDYKAKPQSTSAPTK